MKILNLGIACLFLLFPVVEAAFGDTGPGVAFLDLNNQGVRDELMESGPIILWLTDEWALVQPGTLPQAENILESSRDGYLYLVKTSDLFSYQQICLLPNSVEFLDNLFVVEAEPEDLELIKEPGMSIVYLGSPFSYRISDSSGQNPRNLEFKQSVEDMVNTVSTGTLLDDMTTLVDFMTRRSYSQGCALAGQWIFDKLYSLGFFVTEHYHTSGMAPNIIAEKRGFVTPDQVVIICGHYDSYSRTTRTYAPGADDNATGTTAALQAAEIFKDYVFENTVRFIAFSGEEQGLIGSEAYAKKMAERGEQIIGVYNFDMIGWVEPYPEDLDCIGNDDSTDLIEFFMQCATMYTSLPTVHVVDNYAYYSDHAPFWNFGYQAMCGIEDSDIHYPYYHTGGDTADKIDPGFFTQVAQGAVAATAELAVPVDNPPPTPSPPPFDVGVGIELNRTLFHPGNSFRLGLDCWNRSMESCELELYLVLDINGQYWFWPSWSPMADFSPVSLPPRTQVMNLPILDFKWPEIEGSAQDLRFWTGLFSESDQDIVGEYDMVTWGYEPS